MQVAGDARPFWLGVEMIGEHEWRSVVPPYAGKNLWVEALTLVVDMQTAEEPGRWAYPHRRFLEVRQWRYDKLTGDWYSVRVPRFDRRYLERFTYKPIETDQTIIYRARFRDCVGGDCRVRLK